MTMTVVPNASGQGTPPPPRRRRAVLIEPDRWYNVDDLAAHYDLPKSTVRELIVARVIPGTKVGRGWRAHGADILARDAQLRRASGPQSAELVTPVAAPSDADGDTAAAG